MTKIEIERAIAAHLTADFAAQGVAFPAFPATGTPKLPDKGAFSIVVCESIDPEVYPLHYGRVRVQAQSWALQKGGNATGDEQGALEKAIDRAFTPAKRPAVAAAILAATGDTESTGFYVSSAWEDTEDEDSGRWASEKGIKLGLHFDEAFEAEIVPPFATFSLMLSGIDLEAAFPAAANEGNYALVAHVPDPRLYKATAGEWLAL